MAQVDIFNYSPILIWFFIIFIVFYFIVYVWVLPFIYKSISVSYFFLNNYNELFNNLNIYAYLLNGFIVNPKLSLNFLGPINVILNWVVTL